MQHDHVLKQLNFDLLTQPPGSGSGGGGRGDLPSAGKLFANMLLYS